MIVKEFWHINSSESAILEKTYRSPASEQLLVQVLYSFVSTGTERIVSLGQVPESLSSIMIVPLMEGSFKFPIKYGYSLAGKVIDGEATFLGKNVHIMGPHQNFIIVSQSEVSVIPDGIPLSRAVFVSNMETALNAVWDSQVSAGDEVLICGFGIIGALVGLLIKGIPATKVVVHDTDESRLRIAQSMGFRILQKDSLPAKGFDVGINASGSGEALQLCIDFTGDEGTIVEMSWYGTNTLKLNLGGSFHAGRKKIVSSQVSHINPAKSGRYDLKRRKQVVFEILQNKIFDELPVSTCSFEDLPEVFKYIRLGTYRDFCTLVKYF